VPTATARFFDAMAPRYEVLEAWYEHLYTVLHAILREALAPAAGPGPAPRALDAGYGSGFQAALLVGLGYRTHGADRSAGLLALARRRRSAAALAQADLEALP
jgi:predicted TPR repeat methyltransferase